MFLFGLKKTECLVTLALLLLCLSICPHSTHPHVEEADETVGAEEKNVEHEEDDGEGVHDEDEDSEGEDDLGEDADVENDTTTYPGQRKKEGDCGKEKATCTSDYDCCVGLYCKDYSVSKHCDLNNKG